MNIIKGSSVWQLATFFGSDEVKGDFCSVFTQCLKTIIALFIGCAIVGGVGGFLLADILSLLFLGEVQIITATLLILVAIVALAVGIGYIITGGYRVISNCPIGRNISELHVAFKEKYCPTIKVIEK